MHFLLQITAKDYGFGGGIVGVVWDDGVVLVAIVGFTGCCSGRNADPRLGFNWNATQGFEQ